MVDESERLEAAMNGSFIEKKDGNTSATASMGAAIVEGGDLLENVV